MAPLEVSLFVLGFLKTEFRFQNGFVSRFRSVISPENAV